jgi:RNA methyltransferase, TrmH family
METNMITSSQNPLIKTIARLQQKAAERKNTGLFVIEGRREVSLALRARTTVEHLLYCREIFKPDPNYPTDIVFSGDHKLIEVSRSVYNKLAYRENTEGIMMVARRQDVCLKNLRTNPDPLILVLEGVEKPGNLGAILRTADAAGVDAVLICDQGTDIHNPNVIRSSLGCVFMVPVVTCAPEDALQWLRDTAYRSGDRPKIFAAALQTATDIYSADFSGYTVLVFGAEDKGLSELWREAADELVRIPMAGSIDSLNVSVSVAVLTFEAVRQRRAHAST